MVGEGRLGEKAARAEGLAGGVGAQHGDLAQEGERELRDAEQAGARARHSRTTANHVLRHSESTYKVHLFSVTC